MGFLNNWFDCSSKAFYCKNRETRFAKKFWPTPDFSIFEGPSKNRKNASPILQFSFQLPHSHSSIVHSIATELIDHLIESNLHCNQSIENTIDIDCNFDWYFDWLMGFSNNWQSKYWIGRPIAIQLPIRLPKQQSDCQFDCQSESVFNRFWVPKIVVLEWELLLKRVVQRRRSEKPVFFSLFSGFFDNSRFYIPLLYIITPECMYRTDWHELQSLAPFVVHLVRPFFNWFGLISGTLLFRLKNDRKLQILVIFNQFGSPKPDFQRKQSLFDCFWVQIAFQNSGFFRGFLAKNRKNR